MVNCVNGSFKLPVGHFLIHKLNADQKVSLVNICFQKLDEIGADVISLCCDGPPVNIAAAKKLGATIEPGNFSTRILDRSCYFMLDPAHMIKVRDVLM